MQRSDKIILQKFIMAIYENNLTLYFSTNFYQNKNFFPPTRRIFFANF